MSKLLTPFWSYGSEYDLRLKISEYENGQFALVADCFNTEYNFWEPFGAITVNLDYNGNDPAPEGCAYVDTNNHKNAEDWLQENKLATPLGKTKRSGYCTYPLYQFDIQRIKQIIAEQEQEG